MKIRARGIVTAALALMAVLHGAPDTQAGEPPEARIALTGGRVVTMAGRVHDPGTVLIEGETLSGVGGPELHVPARYERVDVSGAWVVPGLIDSNTSLGLIEVDMEAESSDWDERTGVISPELRVVDAINPASELIPVSRLTGVTTVLVTPHEGNLFSGQAAVIDLAGESVEEMAVETAAFLCMNLGTEAIRMGRSESEYRTRMGLMARVRSAFQEAKEYRRSWERHRERQEKYRRELQEWEKKRKTEQAGAAASKATTASEDSGEAEQPEPPDPPAHDAAKEALVRALDGKLRVLIRAHRQDDVRRAVDVAREHGLRAVLNHGTEAWKVADLLSERDIPVIVGPINTQPDSWETLQARYDTAERLKSAGVAIAIQSGDAHNVRNLPFFAGRAAAHGLPPDEALEAITIGAARVLGIADRYGSLEPGKVANVIVVQGDPLQPESKLLRMYIRGKPISLESKQTELYEKYRKKP